MNLFARTRFSSWLLVLPLSLFMTSASADPLLDEIYEAVKVINEGAKTSQAKVDEITDETHDLFNKYKSELKLIEGLRVYNRQLERQIASQESTIAKLKNSIDEVTVIQRQIIPLMLRMVDALEQFVQLDMPFLLNERTGRITKLRDILESDSVDVSEQYSQLLRAYQIEGEYGRTMESYSEAIEVGGTEKIVDILKVGRVAMVYQTADGEETGWYNKSSKQWEVLDDSYTLPVRNGLKMANKQLTAGLFQVPVIAPEGN